MAKDSEKVRLPELPVFKKYSLALRQEFASVDEILSVLERTTTKIRGTIERAEVPAEDLIDEAADDESGRPFWEEPAAEETVPATPRASLKTKAAPKKATEARAKRAKPAVVRVGRHGKPISAKKPTAKKPTAKKPTAKKPTAKKPTAKKSVARRPQRPRLKPTSRAGSRRK